jgi:hypothetical protein
MLYPHRPIYSIYPNYLKRLLKFFIDKNNLPIYGKNNIPSLNFRFSSFLQMGGWDRGPIKEVFVSSKP